MAYDYESKETTAEEAKEHSPAFLKKAARKAAKRGKRKHRKSSRR